MEALTEKQIEALDFLTLDKCEFIYHPKTENTFECHEVIINRKISIWVKPDGIIFSFGQVPPNYT